MQSIKPVLKNIYQSNTYRKDLSWPHFDDEPRVQEKQQAKDQQSCISVFVACPTVPSSIFFSIWVFFQEHSRITGLQGKGEGIPLTPHYNHPPPRHSDEPGTLISERKLLTTKLQHQPRRDNSIPCMGVW